MNSLRAVGIDLGTTFSAISILNEAGNSEIIPNAYGNLLTPSVLLLGEDSIIVGEDAKHQSTFFPDQTIQFVKRQIGNSSWFVNYQGERLSAVDISSLILKKLKQDAEMYLGEEIEHAVITVPAYFADEQRRSTIEAGEIAGFKVLDLINEPTAAAIAYGVYSSAAHEKVLVYDLGGGTFDVTIMEVDGKDISILGTDGDHQLGGKDFDDAIMRFVEHAFKQEYGYFPSDDFTQTNKLRALAEKAKISLTTMQKTIIPFGVGGDRIRVELTREAFNDLIKVKLDTTLTIVKACLKAQGLKPEDIDRVLLIGGSTKMPAIYDLLANFFQKPPDNTEDPDTSVSLGAAIMAGKLVAEIEPESVSPEVMGKIGGLQVTDVTSHSLGMEAFIPGTTNKINSIIIPRNTPIPAEISKEFITTEPSQQGIRVNILRGEYQDPNLCTPVGEFLLTGLPAGRPAGCKVRVTFSVNTSGVITIKAMDMESGKETVTEVNYRVGQSSEDVSFKKEWASGIIID